MQRYIVAHVHTIQIIGILTLQDVVDVFIVTHTFKHHPCSDGIWECSCIGRCWVTSCWVPITFKDIRAAFLHGVTYQLCIDAMLAMLLKCGTSHALIKVLQSTAHSKLERTVYYICDTFHCICRFWNGRWTTSQHRSPQSRIDRMVGYFHGRMFCRFYIGSHGEIL